MYSFGHRLDHRPGGIDRSLGRIDRRHNAGSGGSVQAEGSGDAWDFPCGQHQSQTQKGIFFEYHQSCNEDGGLQEGGEAEADDLLAPLDEAVGVAAGDAEHIQAAHGDLDEQDTASLQVCKKHLNDGIGHKNDAEQEHDGAGDGSKAEVGAGCHFGQGLHIAESVDDLRGHLANGGSVSSDSGGETALQRDGEFIEPHGYHREETDCHKALYGIEGGLFQVSSAGGILNAAFKTGHHKACAIERPGQIGEKQDNTLYPVHGEQLHAHVAHLGKEVAQKAHDLTVDPINDLAQDSISYKIPNKQWLVHLFSG